jgi:predicted RNA methylase
MQHQIFAISFSNKLSLAPISAEKLEGEHVLDIGTGTGIWAVDFGLFFLFLLYKVSREH